MNFSGIGDLAQNLMLRRQGADLKAHMTRLTEELTTGTSQDTSRRVNGDFSALAGIERHLGQLSAFQRVRDDLSTQIDFVQNGLTSVHDSIDGFGPNLLASAALEQSSHMAAETANARSKLEQVVSSLNTQQGGKYMFSGIATDQMALSSVDTIMSEVQIAIAGAISATDFLARVDAWFLDAGGGFETSAYGGDNAPLKRLRISEASLVEQSISAQDRGFRDIMRGLVVATLVSEGAAPVLPEELSVLVTAAGQNILSGQTAVTSYQAKTGELQAAIEQENVSARAEEAVLSAARAKVVSVDPYEAAAELEAVQFQMETLYVLTARMSQLRLTDYLR